MMIHFITFKGFVVIEAKTISISIGIINKKIFTGEKSLLFIIKTK